MKQVYRFALLIALLCFRDAEVFCQTLNIHSITTVRQTGGDNGYTLDGGLMVNSRDKLLSTINFGPTGNYHKSVVITDAYGTTGSLEQVTSLPLNDVFFFGSFNLLEPTLRPFTTAEIDSLYAWSKRGGRLLIAEQVKTNMGYDPSILNSKWGFDDTLNSPTNFTATPAGSQTLIYNGHFAVIQSAHGGGSSQGYFNLLPPNVVVLATNADSTPTLIFDCNTLDLIITDVDGYTSLGGVSPGPLNMNDQDKFWTNTISFMDALESPPVITKNGNQLGTSAYNSYQWYLNDAPVAGAIGQSFTTAESGVYAVEVDTKIGCKIRSDTVIIGNPDDKLNRFVVPNTFSPNGDSRNDVFRVLGTNIKSMALTIYDRWGELVFESHNQTDGWDGVFKGRPAQPGAFVYYLEVNYNNGEKATDTSTITLLR